MGRRSGFTLTELLVALLLMGVTVGLTVAFSRGAARNAQSQGLTEVLAEVLRSSRAWAMAEQTPVAVVFPAALGQSLYVLNGDVEPRVVRTLDWRRDFPTACVAVAWWDTVPDPTRERPRLGLPSDNFDLDAWKLPHPQDHALLFTPAGTVVTNGWPNVAGNYHLVVGQGALLTAAPVPTGSPGVTQLPACYRLNEVSRPSTIVVSPLGEVWTERRLVSPGSVVLREYPLACGGPSPPLPDGPPAAGPTLDSVTIAPDPARMLLPPGVDCLVGGDGQITLTVEADSPAGHPLYCRWQPSGGSVSIAGEERMSWDGAHWVARHHWRPPPDASEGEKYQLSCKVRDPFGNEAPDLVNSALQFEVRLSQPKLLFVTFSGMYSVAQDCSQPFELSRVDGVTVNGDNFAAWAPDGQRLCFNRMTPAGMGVWTMSADGRGAQLVRPDGQTPSFSPAGTRLAYFQGGDLFVADANGANELRLTNTAVSEECPASGAGARVPQWKPDGSAIMCSRPTALGREVVLIPTDVASPVINLSACVSDPSALCSWPDMAPNGQFVVFYEHPAGRLWKVNIDGTSGATVDLGSYQVAFPGYPKVSPDSTEVLFISSTARLCKVNLVGPPAVQDLGLPATAGVLDWVPDGSRVVYQGPGCELYTAKGDGSDSRPAVTLAGPKIPYGWSK